MRDRIITVQDAKAFRHNWVVLGVVRFVDEGRALATTAEQTAWKLTLFVPLEYGVVEEVGCPLWNIAEGPLSFPDSCVVCWNLSSPMVSSPKTPAWSVSWYGLFSHPSRWLVLPREVPWQMCKSCPRRGKCLWSLLTLIWVNNISFFSPGHYLLPEGSRRASWGREIICPDWCAFWLAYVLTWTFLVANCSWWNYQTYLSCKQIQQQLIELNPSPKKSYATFQITKRLELSGAWSSKPWCLYTYIP